MTPPAEIAADGSNGEAGHLSGVLAVGSRPLGAVRRTGHVQDRGQIHIDAHQGEFPGHLSGQSLHRGRGGSRAQFPSRRDQGEGGLEALHRAAFLVQGDEQGRAADLPGLPLQIVGQLPDLLGALQVPGEEDDAAHLQLPHQLPGHAIQPGAGDAQHEELAEKGGLQANVGPSH